MNSAGPPDVFADHDWVDQWLREHRFEGRRNRGRSELDELRALRVELRPLMVSGRDQAAGQVKAILADEGATPQLVRHSDVDWHIHTVQADAPLARRVLIETAMGIAELVRLDEMRRLSRCADAQCARLVLDLSRNRSRRYCSTTCSNRNSVFVYRQRRAAALGQ